MVTAVTDRPVDLAVGSPRKTVEVVSRKAHPHSETIDECFDFLGLSVVVEITKAVNAWDHREVDGAVSLDQATRRAIERLVEAIAKDRHFVGHSVAISIFEALDDLCVSPELLPGEKLLFLAGPALVESGPVIEGHVGNVADDTLAQELASVADVLDLLAPAVRFRDINPVLAVEAQGGGIVDLALVGEFRERQAFGNGDFFVDFGRNEVPGQREKRKGQ